MATFELNCTACSFSAVIDGDVDAINNSIEAHREDVDGARVDHFVVAWCVP